MIHGDLHTGSVMVTPTDTRVIDPEFVTTGPVGFDLGADMGNLLLSWYSQPGYATAADDRKAMRGTDPRTGDHLLGNVPPSIPGVWREQRKRRRLSRQHVPRAERCSLPRRRAARLTVHFPIRRIRRASHCKMIRRILGFAHNIDFEWIKDQDRRGAAETGALLMARTLLNSS